MVYLLKEGERVAFEALSASEVLSQQANMTPAWHSFTWVNPKLWNGASPTPMIKLSLAIARCSKHALLSRLKAYSIPKPAPRVKLALRLHVTAARFDIATPYPCLRDW